MPLKRSLLSVSCPGVKSLKHGSNISQKPHHMEMGSALCFKWPDLGFYKQKGRKVPMLLPFCQYMYPLPPVLNKRAHGPGSPLAFCWTNEQESLANKQEGHRWALSARPQHTPLAVLGASCTCCWYASRSALPCPEPCKCSTIYLSSKSLMNLPLFSDKTSSGRVAQVLGHFYKSREFVSHTVFYQKWWAL